MAALLPFLLHLRAWRLIIHGFSSQMAVNCSKLYSETIGFIVFSCSALSFQILMAKSLFFFHFSLEQVQIRDWRFLSIWKTCGCDEFLFSLSWNSLFACFNYSKLDCCFELTRFLRPLYPLELWASTATHVFTSLNELAFRYS